MLVNLDTLARRYPALFRKTIAIIGFTSGNHNVDVSEYSAETQRCFAECPPTLDTPPRSLPPQISVAALQAEEQRDMDLRAAEARLAEYIGLGLDPGTTNKAIFLQWHKDHGLQFSAVSVDRAVSELGSKLQWQTEETAAPPTEASTEILGTLPDGSTQLPINTTPSRSHTSTQLKDLLRRMNARKVHRTSHSFGSRF